jgi:hypothetical protein
MFAVYASHADPENPLAALKIGERPEPNVPDGGVRVKISHASLNQPLLPPDEGLVFRLLN